MKYLLQITLFVSFTGNLFADNHDDTALNEQAARWMQKQPVQFLENRGQMMDIDGKPVPFVLFKAEAPGMNMYITEKGLTYVFIKEEKEGTPKGMDTYNFSPPSGLLEARSEAREGAIEFSRIDMQLKGASIKKENIVKETPSATDFSFFYGHCPDGIYGVKQYEKITIKDVYPGIDWVFYNSTGKGAKYDFAVHPGADHKQIEMLYQSKEKLHITQDGHLQIKTEHGNLTENAPESFLDEKPIDSQFKLLSTEKNDKGGYDTRIQFHLPSAILPLTSALVIDPQLTWATFYGGNSIHGPMSIETDNNGNVFVAGYTDSGFPTQNPGGGAYFQGTFAGASDAFILKFNNSGSRLWATYYGGSGIEVANSIATDAGGNVFVAGFTDSGNFPTQNPGGGAYFQGTNAGGYDAFILKFNNWGSLLWATYYGGSGIDWAYSIATDAGGNVFVAGYTASGNFPTQNPGGGAYFQGTFAGGNDAFILKFNNSGSLLWATYYGGSGIDLAHSIATDAGGNVFVGGYTDSGNFPTQNPGGGAYFQGTNAGGDDTFILKFNTFGSLLWATYYGGNGSDWTYSIATDAGGNVFVAGFTLSTNFPTQNPGGGAYFQGTHAGGSRDAFIFKFNNAGVLLWATYYGGSAGDMLFSYDNLAIDNCGNVYMGFETGSSNIPAQSSCDAGYFDNSFNGLQDQFIAFFSNTGILRWATYLGGDGADIRTPIAVDANNNLFVSGEWTGNPIPATYPLTNPGGGAYYNGTFNGSDDGFMVKFTPVPLNLTANITPNTNCNPPCNGAITLTPVNGGCTPYSYLWSNGSTIQNVTGLCAGTYSVTITDSLFCRTLVLNNLTIMQAAAPTPSVTSTSATCGNNNGSAMVTVSGGTLPYTYSWSPSGGSTSAATGLAAGSYTASVTDANGCTQTQTVIITQSTVMTVSTAAIPDTCNQSVGTATATVSSGGTSPFTYQWNNGQTTPSASGLSPGNYTVTVTDVSGCTGTATVVVTSTGGPAIVLSSQTNVLCNGGANGSAAITASGGTSPYTYSWSPSGGTNASASNLSAGTYTVIITDAGGCSSTQTVAITQPVAITTTVSSPPACGVNNGTAAAAVAGGSSPYTYLWSNGQTTSAAASLGSGSYTVIVTDAGGCTQTTTVNVIVNPNPVATAASNVTITQGQSTTLTASGGGNYFWSNGATTAAVVVAPAATAFYCVTVTDANGCTDSACVTVFIEPIDCASAGELYLPNAFSPNNDGENDFLQIYYGNFLCIKSLHLAIFNRWGEKVFETNDPAGQWNGSHREKAEESAVFVYYLKAILITGEEINKKGNVSLIR